MTQNPKLTGCNRIMKVIHPTLCGTFLAPMSLEDEATSGHSAFSNMISLQQCTTDTGRTLLRIWMVNFLLDALDAMISKMSMRPWIMF
jgi:hypothetical protein